MSITLRKRLARDQARQTVDLTRRVGSSFPMVTPTDVWIGSARAYTSALQRRVAYLAWSRRMTPDIP